MTHFKNTNKKLEKLRGIFFQVGLIVAGGLTLVAFEWQTSYIIEIPEERVTHVEIIDELPPVTYSSEPEKPKVKIIETKFNPDKIEIIDDKVNVTEPTDLTPATPDLPFVPDYTEPTIPVEDPIFTIVEKMPEFEGGDRSRLKYLRDNLKYPLIDKAAGIEGTVYMRFLVNKKGKIKDIEILRGVSETIDKEAIRVVKNMPDWKPGEQRGKPVNVSYNFNIKFELR
jgi:protein TonB